MSPFRWNNCAESVGAGSGSCSLDFAPEEEAWHYVLVDILAPNGVGGGKAKKGDKKKAKETTVVEFGIKVEFSGE